MAKQLRAFTVEQGIGRYDFDDYYAVLGLPVTSDTKILRQRYLTIAKLLHPDVMDKPGATQYLAKLVNPSYKFLTHDHERAEYLGLLRLLAKRLIKQSLKDFSPQSEAAKQLMASPNVLVYEQMVKEIARSQFENLDKTIEYMGWLSELNLIYLLIQEGYTTFFRSAEPIKTNPFQQENNPIPAARTPNTSLVSRHLTEAETHIKAKLWTLALQELRSALNADNQNANCHALLGVVYLNQNVIGMAKASFQQALKIDPQHPRALEGMKKIQSMTTAKTDASKKTEPGSKKEKKAGFFGWLGNG